jgi:hypothetical protein
MTHEMQKRFAALALRDLGTATVFDSKSSDEYVFRRLEGEPVIPALHITSPYLNEVNLEGEFDLKGFFKTQHCEEPFVGRYRGAEELGVMIDVTFQNPVMQEAAMAWKVDDRPKPIYWHSNDDDGGLESEYEMNVKTMAAAVGGQR